MHNHFHRFSLDKKKEKYTKESVLLSSTCILSNYIDLPFRSIKIFTLTISKLLSHIECHIVIVGEQTPRNYFGSILF